MGDGGKGDYISPGGNPVSVSEIPDLIPTNLTDFGDSEGGGESPPKSSSPAPGVGMSGVGGGIGAGRSTVVEEPDDPEEDDEGDEESQGDVGEPDPSDGESEPAESDRETTEPDEQEKEDDQEDEHQVMMVIQSDPWDNMGWGLYPIRLRIKEEYGHQVGIYDDLVPVREFDAPRAMKERWERDSKRHKMPVNTSVWDDEPPASTELSNRAFAAARKQGLGVAADYLRRMRVAAIVEGTNIDDEEVLFKLAEEVGLDVAKLKQVWAGFEVKTTSSKPQTPKTFVHADDQTMGYNGYIHINDLKMVFEQAGLDEEDPQPLRGFVREHGPVTANEVMFVYGYESKEEATDRLQGLDGVMPIKYGTTTFWTRFT